ncbi:PqqD family protein [Actinomadura fulvescens]|uniref:PqqD family protein n=1 Tax=Actinomadura fulvescens TaxID=46160 RepID=A0ABN3PKH7_9ACTN
MHAATVPQWSVPLRIRRDNGGVVMVLNYETQTVFFLNALAADVLESIDGIKTMEDLTRLFQQRHPSVDLTVVERDVESIVSKFVAEGTVVLGTC